MEIADGKIIVTGGAVGIGRSVVEFLVERRAKVAVLDRNAAALDELAIGREGLCCRVCDVTDAGELKEAINAVHTRFGGINGLVNNAGVIHSEPLFNMMAAGDRKHSLDAWQRVLDVNLTSVFLVTSHVVEKMAMDRARGVIVNISSVSSKGIPGQSAYAAAKAGVNALTKTWAKELAPLGIRSVAIAPGFVETDSMRNALSENAINEWVGKTSIRRLCAVGEIISAVAFAIENEAVNGKVLEIDGGLTL